jgi:hypothetical protein
MDPGSERHPPAEPAMAAERRRRRSLVAGLVVSLTLLVLAAVVGVVVGVVSVPRGVAPVADPSPRTAQPTPALPSSAPAVPSGSPLPTPPTPPTRPADQLGPWAARISAQIGVPPVAIQAYGYAAEAMRTGDPQCHLGWTTLAGVGQVESSHGQSSGAVLEVSGRSTPVVIGPALDGRGGRALVHDTDAGAFDGDSTYDRAMGPMHLLPAEWRRYSVDADADAIADPYDIDDATLALARLLCAGPEDLSQLSGWNAAIARHHPGTAYATSVFAVADNYGRQTLNIA